MVEGTMLRMPPLLSFGHMQLPVKRRGTAAFVKDAATTAHSHLIKLIAREASKEGTLSVSPQWLHNTLWLTRCWML